MLTVRDLTCGYGGEPVVRGVSFSVHAGEQLCILGPNGCGKTTLLRALAGILPSQGEMTLDGENLRRMSRRRAAAKISLMSQISSVYFSYSVFETVMLGRYLHMKGPFSRAAAEDREVVESCLNDVGLYKERNLQITELSGGQLQRVFLARAFAQQPQIILLDEPTNHLDLKYQMELMERLARWVGEGSRSVVGVLHDLNLALRMADRVLLLDGGETAAFGETKEVLRGERLHEAYGVDVRGFMLGSLSRWTELK